MIVVSQLSMEFLQMIIFPARRDIPVMNKQIVIITTSLLQLQYKAQ